MHDCSCLSTQLLLQGWGQQQLQELGFLAERAQQLVAWARGECSAVVAERPPAKSLSVQMSLTPTPLAAHPGVGPTGSICGDTPGVLERGHSGS